MLRDVSHNNVLLEPRGTDYRGVLIDMDTSISATDSELKVKVDATVVSIGAWLSFFDDQG